MPWGDSWFFFYSPEDGEQDMKDTKVLNFIKVLIFNIIETIIIFFLGNIFNVDVNIRIMFMVLFFLTRMLVGKPKHYNKAYRCALWSCLVFVSLYSLSSLDIVAIIILTIFTAFISTGRADIYGKVKVQNMKILKNI